MLAFTNNNELITTSMNYSIKNIDLISLQLTATSYSQLDKNNRFYETINEEIIKRNFNHLSRYSMELAAIRRFREITGIGDYNNCEYYDKENNIGYRVYLFTKSNPKIYTYKLLQPEITEFFNEWMNFNKSNQRLTSNYDLSKLFMSMDNFYDLNLMFLKENGDELKKTLYECFPEFAIFYYEIYPYLKFEITGKYNIPKLINTRDAVSSLELNTRDFDELITSIPAAENNAKVLKLVRRGKTKS